MKSSKRKNKTRKYHPWKNEWTKEDWLQYIPEMQCELKEVKDVPFFIQENELSKKFHSAIVASSGSSESLFFSVTGYRPDKNNTVIDEHPYVVVFDKKTGESFSEFIDHGNYPGRTETISVQMSKLIQLSGSAVPLSYSRIPSKPSGSLDDLKIEGLLNGPEFYFRKINRESKNKTSN